jgi:hypothetical protein
VSFLTARRTGRHGALYLPLLLSGTFAIACSSFVFGPFFLLPGLAAVLGMMFVLMPADRSRRVLVVGLTLSTILVPAALAWAGVLPQQYELRDDAIIIHAGMLHFPSTPTLVFLLLIAVGHVVASCRMMGRVRDTLTAAEERSQVQAWQMRQMLPREAQVEGLVESRASP